MQHYKFYACLVYPFGQNFDQRCTTKSCAPLFRAVVKFSNPWVLIVIKTDADQIVPLLCLVRFSLHQSLDCLFQFLFSWWRSRTPEPPLSMALTSPCWFEWLTCNLNHEHWTDSRIPSSFFACLLCLLILLASADRQAPPIKMSFFVLLQYTHIQPWLLVFFRRFYGYD